MPGRNLDTGGWELVAGTRGQELGWLAGGLGLGLLASWLPAFLAGWELEIGCWGLMAGDWWLEALLQRIGWMVAWRFVAGGLARGWGSAGWGLGRSWLFSELLGYLFIWLAGWLACQLAGLLVGSCSEVGDSDG